MKKQKHKIIIEFTNNEKGLEYFRNADGKLVSQPIDDTINYRDAELAPEVLREVQRAREIHNYPSRPMIDNLVHMQGLSIDKAVKYVRYRLLGEATYLDVFGQDAEDRRAAQAHYKKQDAMAAQLQAMAAQMADMQKLIFNMAAQMNRESSSYKRVI